MSIRDNNFGGNHNQRQKYVGSHFPKTGHNCQGGRLRADAMEKKQRKAEKPLHLTGKLGIIN